MRQDQLIMAEGALPTRVKELLAVALSFSTRCEPRLKVHVGRACDDGATPEEVAETIAVTALMDGGPAYAWSKRTMDELLRDRPSGV